MTYHLLASPLLRPNGIVEFIRALIEHTGGELVTDAEPAEPVQLPYQKLRPVQSVYLPITLNKDFGNGLEPHPWLHWDEYVYRDMIKVAERLPAGVAVFTHCAISEAACQAVGIKTVFVQHESDVYYPSARLSYLSDHWLDKHRELMRCGTVGLTMPATAAMVCKETVPVPYPLSFAQLTKTADEGDVVAFFDTSYRKGWDRYLAWWEANGKPETTVITRQADPRWPAEWKRRAFMTNETAQKLQCIRNHKRAFVPSRSEVTCLALLECMSQVPTMTFSDPWTEPYATRVERVG